MSFTIYILLCSYKRDLLFVWWCYQRFTEICFENQRFLYLLWDLDCFSRDDSKYINNFRLRCVSSLFAVQSMATIWSFLQILFSTEATDLEPFCNYQATMESCISGSRASAGILSKAPKPVLC